MEELIRQVLRDHGSLAADAGSLSAEDDLYLLGLTSHASVNVMLALEEVFGIEFPDTLLRKSTFQSISAVQMALSELGARSGPAVEPDAAASR